MWWMRRVAVPVTVAVVPRPKVLVPILVTAGALALTACSSDDDSASSTTTSPKQAVCAARSELRQSIDALMDPSLLSEGKSGIQSALDDVEQDLDDLASAAKDAYQPQVDDVKSSIDQLQDAVSSLGDGSVTEGLQNVGNAVADVGSTTGTLIGDLETECPSN
jgi:hypothetical protein